MALVKPIAQGISAFDATQDKTFGFVSNGGSQIVANRITIRLQSDNSVVYQNKVTSYRFEQTVPANTLTNNNYYNFYFNTYDVEGNEREPSDAIQFYCFSEPTLTFTNIPSSSVIENSGYSFDVTYNQTEGELLYSLIFYLYDNFDNLIAESEPYYGGSDVPVSFSHSFNGFDNNVSYKIEVIATSLNGMIVSTGKHIFTVRYYYPQIFSLLDLENVCNEGYVNIKSNVVVADGETAPEYTPPTYRDNNTMIAVYQYGNWIQWTQGFSIKSSFTFTAFMKAGRLGQFAILGTEENGFTIELIREIPYGETEVKDRFEVNGYVNGVRKVHQTSNYVDIINQKSYYLIWFRKNGNVYDLQFNVLQRGIDTFEWGNSNIEYERLTTIQWMDESYAQGKQFTPQVDIIEEIFPLSRVRLYNGIYDNMNVTNDINSPFTTNIPTWGYDTRIACDFNGNVDGGNVNVALSTLKYMRIKRREKGTFNWITIKQYEIHSVEDMAIILRDYYSPTGYESEYALVPVMDGNVEGDYIVNGITTKFSNVTIADSNNAFNLRANIIYGGDTINSPTGIYYPLKGKYPIIEKNSELEYYSGSITATMLGYNFEKTKRINRVDIVKQTDDFCSFLNNMKSKIIKDWNGNIHMVRFTGSPTVSYNSSYGNGIAQVTANWVEQGQFDNQNDLYYNGLTDVLS